mgnify:CR=1 FL=1
MLMCKPRRCKICGRDCPEESVNRCFVNELTEFQFQLMIEEGLTCEQVYEEVTYDYE